MSNIILKELTPEQEAKLGDYAEKWIDIGFSLEPIDIPKTLAALKIAYQNAGIAFPSKYEVYDSPFQVISAMKEKYNLDVDPQDFIFGQHEAYWLSLYDYFYTETCIERDTNIDPLIDLAKYAGWILTFDELIVLTHRPVAIEFDAEGRTHCENDFAIKFRDDTGVVMWHGVRIEQQDWILDTASLTAEKVLKHSNVEQRRIGCEILGWDKILESLKHTVINEDADPTVGTLLEVDLPDSGLERFLMAIDPNVGKTICLPVPGEMKTALEANSWTYGIDALNFKPDLRV